MQFSELKDGCLMVDYLGSEGIEYTVDSVPWDLIYKHYTDGGCLKQFLFVFGSWEFYGADVLPDLDGRNTVFIETTTRFYLFSADTNSVRYQIQLRLI